MRQISSSATFFYKWIFPTIWLGSLLLFVAILFVGALSSGQLPSPAVLIALVILVGVGYFVLKNVVFGLVDEIYDVGDGLIIRNSDREERIALSEIKNVNYSLYSNPRWVTLSLKRPSIFGQEVKFLAPMGLSSFSTSPLVDELIEKIKAKRTG